MQCFLAALVAAAAMVPCATGSANCDTHRDCSSCTSAKTWTGSTCRWCPLSGDESCHAEGSLSNKCDRLQQITQPTRCEEIARPLRPTQVRIAFGGSYREMTVSWRTTSGSTSSLVRFGTTKDSLASTATGVKLSYIAGAYHHHVTLSGLEPSTTYFYQAGDGGAWSADDSSAVLSFVSAPKDDGSVPARPLTVSIFGDWGYGVNGKAVQTRDRLEALKADFDFVWHVGDIAYPDDAFLHDTTAFEYEQVYDAWMEWVSNISSAKPYMVSPGNHESECHSPACITSSTLRHALSNFSAYNARWRMPFEASGGTSNMWYSFDVGLAHFVSLDTETDFPGAAEGHHGDSGLLPAGGFGRDGEYLAWLEADLRKANASRSLRPWILVGGHRQVYDASGRDKAVGGAVEELFHKYGVDAYFCGHVHSYARSVPVYQSKPTPGATTYILAGGAGNDEGMDSAPKHPAAWNAFADGSEWGTGLLHVLNRTHLHYEYVSSATGAVKDEVVIAKQDMWA